MGISRLQKLHSAIAEKRLDALLISQPENRRYLSNFTGSSGWLLISENHSLLATDFRYIQQAKKEAQDFEIRQIKEKLRNWLPNLASDLGLRKLGFEANHLSFASYYQLNEAITTKQLNLQLIPTVDLVEKIRSVKEPEEIELIIKAVELADVAFEQAKSIIHPGMTQREIAWEIEKLLRQKESEALPFDPIVASGPDSALPHAKATDRVIHSNEPVLIDMGAKFDGYCSNLSRTLCLGKPDETLSKVYNIVLEAQSAAIEGIKTGMEAIQVDRLARSVIEQTGYGDAFGHSLGHGVGLAVHELPAVSPNSSDLLQEGMVFTVEPGIYISGWGGVRIEDVVTLQEGKVRVLSASSKRLN